MGEVKVSSISHACVSVATRDQQRELVCLFFPLEVIMLYPYSYQVAVAHQVSLPFTVIVLV